MSEAVGVVLAGGAGRRMGRTKGDIPWEGGTLALRAASALARHCRRVVISVAPGASNPAPGFEAVEDEPPAGRGPLGGLASAFARGGGADLLVLACDYPWAGPELLGVLVVAARPQDQIVFPVDAEGRDHPLVALWRGETETVVREALVRGELSVRGVLGASRVRRIGAQAAPELDWGRSLSNWNTPNDPREGSGAASDSTPRW